MNLCMCVSGQASPYGRWHKLVTILDLKSNDLMGRISSHVGNLSFLRTLDLLNNIFTSQIPPQILRLSRLTKLLLYSNTLRGPIPQIYISHCFGLQLLDLAYNFLTGKVPTEVGLLSKLKVLDFSFNYLDGVVSDSIGNLSSPKCFGLAENNMHGRIPTSFVAINNFSGKVLSFVRSSKLKNLATQSNNLESPEDDDLSFLSSLAYCSHLRVLTTSRNNFQLMILPKWIGYLSSIEENQLTDPIPSSIDEVPVQGVFNNATALFIVENTRLCGGIPQLKLSKWSSNPFKKH
ncbi:hypothetical protein FEM48_ZijujUnG0061400 [Ziziphus jujuba var. spinosa]|uniref:Uncharacterized protein n=1 Tax=Ziziphus jujuba var. spinosa TaxID=714518 RepID=A0A978U903_ZIZJJ|nr:hypothetical protein FEM48_ZijujUnG0061400 [Ziziphus jujuba var. spinosa]